jgi:putative acetyltransferase
VTPAKPLTIRNARAAEAEAIARLHHQTRDTSMAYLPKLHTVEAGITFFSDVVLKEWTVVVAEREGVLAGYCAYRDGWLGHLYVHPVHQGQGIGSILLKHAMTEKDHLQLWVFQKNLGAIRLYERVGFDLVRTTDGSANEEHEPDALYRRRRKVPAS